MTYPLAFDIHEDNGVALVRVGDSVFSDNRDELMAVLLRLADTPGTRIVIDLSKVAMFDSAALSMLVLVHQRTTAGGGWLRLSHAQPLVRKLLHVTNLDRLIPTAPDDEEDPGVDAG
ncbi:STAS domain-containing protein [Actinoplanes sp. CA-252034]|uniref:STAS domain-containing protein n=1 Tax=Actinoplanes sp. CA-252034 TaxID=3239906 RepID=UPI003D993F2E